MARKVEVQLVDDIDGGKAEETVAFGLDGASYEIDLSVKHAKELRGALEKYVTSGRKLSRDGAAPTARSRGRAAAPARNDREQNKAIREWAKRKNIELSDRGRIPRSIVEQYEAEAGR